MTASFATSRVVSKRAVRSRGGVVAAQNRQAAAVGAEVLAAGGNAVDAAIATSMALGVLEPWMSGIGGGATMLVHLAETGTSHAIDAGMIAPLALDPADYPLTGAVGGDLFGWPQVVEDRNLRGPLSVAVPGLASGLGLLHERFASMPVAELLAPAIALARRGLPVDWWAALMVTQAAAELVRDPVAHRVWLPGGLPPASDPQGNEKYLPLPGLADSLATLAEEGFASFYRGALATRILEDAAEAGTRLAAADLARYRARLVEPLAIATRGGSVLAMPGLYAGRTLERVLALLADEPAAAGGDGPDAADYLAVASALEQAYGERLATVGDSAAAPASTSHLAVVDAQGNLVSLTQTLLSPFGSKVLLAGTGILLNNGVMWFDPRPGGPNAIAAGKRPLSNMCPVLAFGADGGRLALGASGGRKILPAVLQILRFVLAHGMGLEQALAQPRIDASGGGTVTLDGRLGEEVRTALAARFPVRVMPPLPQPLSFACPVAVLRDGDGIQHGAAEPLQPWADAVAGSRDDDAGCGRR